MKKYTPRILTYLSMPLMFLAILAFVNFNLTEFLSSKVLLGFGSGWFCYLTVSLLLLKTRNTESTSTRKFSQEKNSWITALLAFSVAACCASLFMKDISSAQFYAQFAAGIAYFCVEIYLIYYETNFEEILNRKKFI